MRKIHKNSFFFSGGVGRGVESLYLYTIVDLQFNVSHRVGLKVQYIFRNESKIFSLTCSLFLKLTRFYMNS